jgi:hypothetical protein
MAAAHAAPVLTRNQQQLTVIDRRFSGLPEISHGGYVAGVLASALAGDSAEVRMRRPVPPGRRLSVERADNERVELRDGEQLLAEGVAAELALDVPAPLSLAEAEAASMRHPGLHGHPFPGCFGCGTERHAGDGLRIFPGPVAGRKLVAAPWTPAAGDADAQGHVPGELVWAALDCPQLWSLMVHAPATPDRVVTAALATRLERPVVAGEPHVVIAWPIGREGRKWLAGAALFAPDGELCAVGRQTAAAVTGWGIPLGRDRWGAADDDDTTTRGGRSDYV